MKNNNLTIDSIPKLVRRLAIPASVGFIFHTLYNVVDTYYAGLISTETLAALALSFPVFFLIIALGSGISTGATALIANSLGSGNEKESIKYSAQALSFGVLASVFLTFLGLTTSPFLFGLLGATGEYLEIALSYINVIFYGTILFLMTFILNSILTAQGNTKTFRNVLILGFFLNLIFDPWLMFGGFGVPALGVAGVAWATLATELVSMVYLGVVVAKSGIFCKECLPMFKPKKYYFVQISKQGLPASLNMGMVAIGIFIITYYISFYSKDAVAAYGIATRIDQVALLPTIGLNMATLALVGQNNGAKLFKRCREAIKTAMLYGQAVTTLGAVLVFLFARFLMGIFSEDAEVIQIGVVYLRISVLVYWAYTALFISVSALQGFKKPMYALWIGLYRQVVAPLIIFYLLARVLGMELLGIWWGIFIINWSSVVVTIAYLKQTIIKLEKKT